jgi:hypothetical protein
MALKLSVIFDGKNQKLKQATKDSEAALQGLQSTALRVTGVIAAAYSTATSARALLDNQKMVDRWNAQMRVAAGGTEEARVKMGELKTMARETGTDLGELVNGFTRLAVLGLNPTEETMLSYMNTSRAMGKSLEQFIEAVADASVAEFERLKEFGIKARNEGETIKFTFQGITTEVENNANAIQDFLRSLGENQFAGTVKDQADTVEAAMNNFRTQWIETLQTINESGIGDAMKESIKAGTEALGGFTTFIQEEGETIVDVGKAIAAVFAARILGSTAAATQGFIVHQAAQTRVIARYAAMNGMTGMAATRLIAVGSAARVASAGMAMLGGPVGVIALVAYGAFRLTEGYKSNIEASEKWIQKERERLQLLPQLSSAQEEYERSFGRSLDQSENRMRQYENSVDESFRKMAESLSHTEFQSQIDKSAAALRRAEERLQRYTEAGVTNQMRMMQAKEAVRKYKAEIEILQNIMPNLTTSEQQAAEKFGALTDKLAEQILALSMSEDAWERHQIMQQAGANLTDQQVAAIDRLIGRIRQLKAEANLGDVIDEMNQSAAMAGMSEDERERYRYEQRVDYRNLAPEQRMQFDQSWNNMQQAEERQQVNQDFSNLQETMSQEGMSPLDRLESEKEQRIAIIERYAEMERLTEEQTQALITQVHEQEKRKREQLQAQQLQHNLAAGQQLFSGLAGMAKAFSGEQSGIYKAMFAASQAFAIAQSIVAIQTGIAQAASLPFPANLGAMATVAAETASIVTTIKGTNYQGQAHDGIARVPASHEGTWMLRKDEMVLNPEQRENFEFLVDHLKSQRPGNNAAAGGVGGGGSPRIEIFNEFKFEGGAGGNREEVEQAVTAANERFKAELIDDFSSGGRIYQTLKAKGG